MVGLERASVEFAQENDASRSEPRCTEATLRVLAAADARDTFRVEPDEVADPLHAELHLLDAYLRDVRSSDIVPSSREATAPLAQ